MAEIQKHGQKVAGQHMALDLENESLRLDPESKAWHIMPKLHMFQHICGNAHKPKDYWYYQNEITGGFRAKLFKRRGGKNPGNNAANCLLRWQSLTHFPALPLD